MIKRSMLKVFQVISIFVLLSVVFFSYITGFYGDGVNLSGIWVAVHGVVIEFVLISLIFSWYEKVYRDVKKSKTLSYANYIIYDALEHLIGVLWRNRILGEKYYVYFGDDLVISRDTTGIIEMLYDRDDILRQHELGVIDFDRHMSRSLVEIDRLHSLLSTVRPYILRFFNDDQSNSLLILEMGLSDFSKKFESSTSGDVDIYMDFLDKSYPICKNINKIKGTLEDMATSIFSREEMSSFRQDKSSHLFEKQVENLMRPCSYSFFKNYIINILAKKNPSLKKLFRSKRYKE